MNYVPSLSCPYAYAAGSFHDSGEMAFVLNEKGQLAGGVLYPEFVTNLKGALERVELHLKEHPSPQKPIKIFMVGQIHVLPDALVDKLRLSNLIEKTGITGEQQKLIARAVKK